MKTAKEGDRVRVDIPDKSDPDFGRYHGETGVVTTVISDNAGRETGDECDSYIYSVELDSGEEMDFRWRDLRPEE